MNAPLPPASDALPAAVPNDAPPSPAAAAQTAHMVAELAHRLGGIGRSAARIAGSGEDLGTLAGHAERVFGDVRHSLGAMTNANRAIAGLAEEGVRQAEKTHCTVRRALDRASGLAEAVSRVEHGISDVSGALRQVGEASQVIDKIAFQTRIVAFNASVEAVRAGDAGRGFGVVAQAVKDLAQQVSDSSRQIAGVIDELEDRVKELARQVQASDDGYGEPAAGHGDTGLAAQADASQLLQEAIDSFEQNFSQVESLLHETARHCADSRQLGDQADARLAAFGEEFAGSVTMIGDIREESALLLTSSEEAFARCAQQGVVTEDTPFIQLARQAAAVIAAGFEAAVDQGQISLAQLFDENYRPLPDTNPQQYMTDFVAFTDATLPRIQEQVLQRSPLISFCAAVDRNGFLPTHNHKFSRPQGRDLNENAAYSRHRRLFNDRTGLRAARNRQDFLLQTYRRQMGAGVHVVVKDVSAPIIVQGRHWGALRIGYNFAD